MKKVSRKSESDIEIYKKYKDFSDPGSLPKPEWKPFLLRNIEKIEGLDVDNGIEYKRKNRSALYIAERRLKGKHLSKNFDELIAEVRDGGGNEHLDYYLEWVKFSCPDKSKEMLDRRGGMGMTLLEAAIEAESVELVKLLIEQGASVKLKDKNGRTPLQKTIFDSKSKLDEYIHEHRTFEISKLLLESGADPISERNELNQLVEKRTSVSLEQCRHQARRSEGQLGDIALEHVNEAINNGEKRAMFGIPLLLSINLKHGKSHIDINATDENGDTLLHKAARLSKLGNIMSETLDVLIEHGAQHIQNKQGHYPEDLCGDKRWKTALEGLRKSAKRTIKSRVSTDYLGNLQSGKTVNLNNGTPKNP